MPQANVFDAMGQSYNALQTSFQDGARTRAGRAYGEGDREGAISALGQGGLVSEASALDDTFMRRDYAMQDQQRADQAQRAEFMLNATTTLRRIPAANRAQAYQQLRPVLESFIPPEVLEQMDAADMSDATLDAFAGALGQEAERLQLFQLPNGGDIIGVSQSTGEERSRVRGPGPDPLDVEYRQAQIDAMRAQVPLRQAQAARAARPAASGGGSRSSGGGSAPAARPAGRPWERY